MKRINKGEYGYISSFKKRYLILSILSLIAVLVIFLTGIIIYHSNKSIFSVIAAVSAIPAAKLMTMYISVLPHRSGDNKLYNELETIKNSNTVYNAIIGCDFIITSRDNAYNIQFAYITNGNILMFTNNQRTNPSAAEEYIKKIFNENKLSYSRIKVYSKEDEFLKSVKEIAKQNGKEYPDKRLLDKMCSYSF